MVKFFDTFRKVHVGFFLGHRGVFVTKDVKSDQITYTIGDQIAYPIRYHEWHGLDETTYQIT